MKQSKTFYISGFDPRGSRSYYQLFKQEAKKQAIINPASIKVGGRQKTSAHNHGWSIVYKLQNDSSTYQTDYEFLGWDDIIRDQWTKNPLSLFCQGIKTYAHILTSRTWEKYYVASKVAAFTIMLPFILFIITLLMALCLCFIITSIGLSLYMLAIIPCAIFLFYKLTIFLIKKYNILWLLRGYIFASNYALNGNTAFDTRITHFTDYLVKALSSNQYDTILVVAHSMGAIPLTCLIANLLRHESQLPLEKLSIMTLGHSIPLLSLLPEAKTFRQNLTAIAASKKINWVDYSAPIDGVCFAQTSPFFGVCEDIALRSVELRSPRFHKLFSSQTYCKIKRDKFRIHFQYLMSAELIGNYDFFDIVAKASFTKRDP